MKILKQRPDNTPPPEPQIVADTKAKLVKAERALAAAADQLNSTRDALRRMIAEL